MSCPPLGLTPPEPQGSHLFWFAPIGTTGAPPPRNPKGHIWLDGAYVEPIITGCVSDSKSFGRLPVTTADAPPGVPPWGIAVEARPDMEAGQKDTGHRLVLAADSRELRVSVVDSVTDCQWRLWRLAARAVHGSDVGCAEVGGGSHQAMGYSVMARCVRFSDSWHQCRKRWP